MPIIFSYCWNCLSMLVFCLSVVCLEAITDVILLRLFSKDMVNMPLQHRKSFILCLSSPLSYLLHRHISIGAVQPKLTCNKPALFPTAKLGSPFVNIFVGVAEIPACPLL